MLAYASDREGKGDQDLWVQPLRGGRPIRLTRHPATDRQLDFSPDGSAIAFRSDREGGGIYVVSVRGGDERRIADHGYNPRYSPDGTWISYARDWVVHVVSAAGGPPRVVHPDMEILAGPPLWTPDRKHLLFMGAPASAGRAPAQMDCSGVTGPNPCFCKASETPVLTAGPPSSPTTQVFPSDWLDHSILFSARAGDTTNVWQIPISPATWRPAAPTRQLTFGQGVNLYPRVLPDRRLVFASENRTTHIWRLPLDANRGIVTGPPEQLTRESGTRPRLSADGRKLVFSSRRRGHLDIWLKDLASGQERAVAAAPWLEGQPLISPDGSQVARASSARCTSRTWPVARGRSAGSAATLWTGRSTAGGFFTARASRRPSFCWTSRRGKRPPLPGIPASLFGTRPFRRTLAGRPGWPRRLFVARHPGGPQAQWRLVAENVEDSSPQWSPDGNLLFFLSERDDWRCIWAQRLDPATREPQRGKPSPCTTSTASSVVAPGDK